MCEKPSIGETLSKDPAHWRERAGEQFFLAGVLLDAFIKLREELGAMAHVAPADHRVQTNALVYGIMYHRGMALELAAKAGIVEKEGSRTTAPALRGGDAGRIGR